MIIQKTIQLTQVHFMMLENGQQINKVFQLVGKPTLRKIKKYLKDTYGLTSNYIIISKESQNVTYECDLYQFLSIAKEIKTEKKEEKENVK